jgi:hypothetical protein
VMKSLVGYHPYFSGGVMNIRDANICINCDEISTEEACPICTSVKVYPLRRWLSPLSATLAGQHKQTLRGELNAEQQEQG